MEILRTEGLTKRFGGIVAVNEVTIAVRKGEMMGIIGPNGAGKTTLFSLISGTEKPDEGRVFFEGRDVTGLKPYHLNKLGLVRTFQIVRPFKSLTVLQNLLVPGTVKDRGLNNDRLDELLKSLGLADKKNLRTTYLTHGEMKKLEVARALASNPKLLLLDEPFGGLTYSEIEEVYNTLTTFRKDGLTIVIIEHRLRELMRMVERIAVMDQGRIIFDGVPADVPKSEQVVKAYLGTSGGFDNA
jgi:branched-chain amino acid transport system ATP-binding protein